jgi:hypothetical protein
MVNVVSVSACFCNLLSNFFVNVLRSLNFLIVLQNVLAFIVILSCFLLQCIINVCDRKWWEKIVSVWMWCILVAIFCGKNHLKECKLTDYNNIIIMEMCRDWPQ